MISAAGAITLGCSDGDAMSAPQRDVEGTYVNTYIWETGETTAPRTDITVAAIVPQPDDEMKTIDGEVREDGSFHIKDPGESYYLKLSGTDEGSIPSFYWTRERTFDFGGIYGRRPDAKEITMTPTTIDVSANGLNPWQADDSFELYSLGAGIDLFRRASPELESTELNVSIDASLLTSANLIEGSKGDVVYLTQLVSRNLGDFPYSSVGKSLKPAPFTMSDGGSTPVGGTFEDVPQETLSIDWRRSKFAALAEEAHPSATLRAMALSVYAEPGGATRFTGSASPNVIYAYADRDESDFHDVAGDLSFGNPFPKSWALVGTAFMVSRLDVPLPGASEPTRIYAGINCVAPVSDSGPVVLEPDVRPAKNLRVNERSTEGPITGAGLSPTVSWDAPDVDGALRYHLSVRKLDPMTTPKTIATIFTWETSAVVPEGILSAGGLYSFRVTVSRRSLDLIRRSDVVEYGCSAQAVTHLIQP